jgi:cysteinyl-tRNA synthetase
MTAFQRLNRQEPGAVAEAIGLLTVLGFEFADETPDLTGDQIQHYIDARKRALDNKNYKVADDLRDFLSQNGIQLKDGKDPATGERITTWEVKR